MCEALSVDSKERVPEQVGPYRLEKEIGRGGMGAVYRAFHQPLARPVALKRVRPGGGDLERRRERFAREARAAARLSHPNIVQVYDILADGDEDWIVMELAEGVCLGQLVSEGPLSLDRGLAIASDILRGLAAAHARKIIHRDLKAENVVVTASGQAKILDFGLAKIEDDLQDDGLSTGELMGTVRSMSPEQAACRVRLDHRSDLFSFGTLLYEIFTGKSPFLDRSVVHTLERIVSHEQRPLCEAVTTLPRELSDLVDALLEKDPDQRPQSAEEVLLRLEKLRYGVRGPSRILFVDDEPDFAHLIRLRYRKLLQAGEIEIELASDGVEALEKLRADDRLGVVMADINMPRMDGLTLLEEISRLGRPVVTIMVSAYGDMVNIRRAMNLGAFDFITKPIDFKDLERTREKALEALRRQLEHEELRRKNRLLEERNRAIRAALVPCPREAWIQEGVWMDATVVSLGWRRTPGSGREDWWSACTAALTPSLFSHGGVAFGWHPGTEPAREGSLSVVFGLPLGRDAAAQAALAWVEEIQQAPLESLEVEVRAGVVSGRLRTVESPGPNRRRRLEGPAFETARSLEKECHFGEVLLSKKTLAKTKLAEIGPLERLEGPGEVLEALRVCPTLC